MGEMVLSWRNCRRWASRRAATWPGGKSPGALAASGAAHGKVDVPPDGAS
jgi:hypothetical protein